MKTFDELVAGLEISKPNASKTLTVDLSEVLGEGAVFGYREPSLYDLYAIAEPRVLSEWRQYDPEMPDTLAMLLELVSRLHISPPCQQPTGQLYATLLTRLGTAQALRVLKQIEQALTSTFGLGDIAEQVAAKKRG